MASPNVAGHGWHETERTKNTQSTWPSRNIPWRSGLLGPDSNKCSIATSGFLGTWDHKMSLQSKTRHTSHPMHGWWADSNGILPAVSWWIWINATDRRPTRTHQNQIMTPRFSLDFHRIEQWYPAQSDTTTRHISFNELGINSFSHLWSSPRTADGKIIKTDKSNCIYEWFMYTTKCKTANNCKTPLEQNLHNSYISALNKKNRVPGGVQDPQYSHESPIWGRVQSHDAKVKFKPNVISHLFLVKRLRKILMNR